jgi:hypothetical protein
MAAGINAAKAGRKTFASPSGLTESKKSTQSSGRTFFCVLGRITVWLADSSTPTQAGQFSHISSREYIVADSAVTTLLLESQLAQAVSLKPGFLTIDLAARLKPRLFKALNCLAT